MSWIALLLGLALAAAGGAGLMASLDLLTTQLGLIYALCGAVAASGGVIVIAIALLIRRVDALRRTILRGNEQARSERLEPVVQPVSVAEAGGAALREAPTPEIAEPAIVSAAPAVEDSGEREISAINENRRGYAPSQETAEPAAQEPVGPPSLIGRYSAGGAKYSIFSDGSIEAETDQGAFKFGSMSEFKAFIAGKRN
jgi:hypothetical protein